MTAKVAICGGPKHQLRLRPQHLTWSTTTKRRLSRRFGERVSDDIGGWREVVREMRARQGTY